MCAKAFHMFAHELLCMLCVCEFKQRRESNELKGGGNVIHLAVAAAAGSGFVFATQQFRFDYVCKRCES